MVRITVASIGKTALPGCTELEHMYIKRTQQTLRVTVQYVRGEKELVELVLQYTGIVVLLDERGTHMTSQEFSDFLSAIELRSESVLFVIGDAMGLPKELKNKKYTMLQLSAMTFPHDIARVMLLEQLYRAQTIMQQHPYHK